MNWEKLISDPFVLNLVHRYKIPFLSKPVQNYVPQRIQMNQKKFCSYINKLRNTEKKGNPKSTAELRSDFKFNICNSKERHRPVTNLEKLLNKQTCTLQALQKSMFLLNEILQKGDYMCKIYLKDAYFSVPFHSESQTFVKFQWKGQLFQFLCLCFCLGRAPKIFTKLLRFRSFIWGSWWCG